MEHPAGLAQAPWVVCSVLEANPQRAAERIAAAPRGCALVELRADRLGADEVAALVRGAGRAVLVAVRRRADGGCFEGDELERLVRLRAGLEAGACLVDVECDVPLSALSVGAGEGERLVVSHHGDPCRLAELRARLRHMAGLGARWLKIVPEARGIDETAAVRELLQEARRDGQRLAAFASGPAGAASRILAPAWGSWATYGSFGWGAETAPGQLPAAELLEIHGVLERSERSHCFGLVGSRVSSSPSPAMHAAGYRACGLDACYLPLETDDLDAALRFAGACGAPRIEALGVTRPFKEILAVRCLAGDEIAAASGAVNTVCFTARGPVGYNTDGPAAVARLALRLDPRGARVAVLGSGGAGRAYAAALVRAGAEVVLYGRSPERTRRAAERSGARAAADATLAAEPWDVLIHATPQGADGTRFLEPERLDGRVVVDAVYAPQATALVRDARARGLETIDGLELLAAQAVLQFERMTGHPADHATLHAAGAQWLASRLP